MAVNMLNAGQAAFVSYETDVTLSGGGSPDGLRFVLLADILSGTTLYITDRTWDGSAFTSAAGDGTFTYSAASDLPAGTIVTLSHAELAAEGVNLSSVGESVYLYQGSDADTPGTFIFSMNIANTSFGNTLLNTGLVSGINAVTISQDNAVYSGSALGMPVSQSRDIAIASRWFGSDQDDIAGTADYSEVIDTTVTNAFTAPDMVLIATMAGGGQSDAILRVGNDDAANVGTGLTRLFRDNPAFNRLADVTFDLDAGHYFVVDSDGNNINRILRGDIADLKNSNENPTLLTIFSTDGLNDGAGSQSPGELIPSIEIDKAAQKIYWMDGDLFGSFEGGFQLWEANYDGTGATLIQTIDTENIDPNFGFPGGVGDFAVTGGFAYVVSSTASIDGLGNTAVDQNHILKINLANGDVTFLDLGDAGLGDGFHDGRLDPAQGQIIGIDVDTVTGDIWFVTQGISSSDNGGIFRFAQGGTTGDMVGGTLTEMWEMPAEGDFSSIQSFPTSNLTHIEIDEIGGRYYVSATSDATVAESDASIFSGSLTAAAGTAPTLFVRAFEPTANGAPQGMEIDYAPVNSAVGTNATFVEGGAAAGIFASVTLTDADNAKAYLATFTITEGFTPGDMLVTGAPPPGLQTSYNASTSQLEISRIDGEAIDLADLEAILEQVAFSSTSDNPTNYGANQTRTIAFTTSDGLATSDPVSVTITVEGVNDAPVNTLGSAVTGVEDQTISVTGLSISDLDADPANQDMQVTLTAAFGTLTLDPTTLGNLSFSVGDGGSDTTMTFSGRANDINAALATLSLAPPANHNGTLDITITTSDLGHTGTGGPATDSDTKTITINPVNDAPVVSGDGTESAETLLEDVPSVNGQTVSALFSGQFSDQLDNQVANGGSSANTLAGIAVVQNGSAPGTGQWEWFNGTTWNNIGAASDSAAPIFSASTAIRFNPAPDYNGAAPTLTVHLIDSSALLAGPNATTVNISAPTATGGTTAYSAGTVVLSAAITPVNDAPTIAELDNDTVIYVEQSSSPSLDDGNDALIGDIDSANFDGGSLTVQITTGLQLGEDTIAISTAGVVSVSGLTVSVSGTQIGTFAFSDQDATIEFAFNADATPAAVQALVRSLVYANTAGDDPTEGDRTIEWSLVDGDGSANGGSDTATVSTTVSVQAVNDAPTAIADDDSVQEDTAPNPITGNVLTNDIDPEDDTLVVTSAGTFMLSYGSLIINSDGSYSYTLDNANPLVDALSTGDTLFDTFTYTVSDGNGGQDTALLTITIDGKSDNAAPESTDNSATIDEDTTYTFAATDFAFADADMGDELVSVRIDTLSIPAGATLRLSGVDVVASDVIAVGDIPNLVFTPAPDANGTNYASFTFSVSDGTDFDTTPNTFSFQVDPVADTPTITSDGGGATASVNVAENTTAVTTVVANDPDAGTTLSYSITGGADAAKFTIDATTGALAFAAAPDFETPTDVGGNNVYDVQVTASDGALSDVQDIAVTVTNANEAPTITSDGGGVTASVNFAENITAVTTVVATDPDAATTLTYSISGGADAAKFTIDATTGALAFAAAPDFETPTDVGGNNVYDVEVTASDGTLTDVQDIAVTVTNLNEAPTISSNGAGATAAISIAENIAAVTTVVATDPDAGTTLNYSISGGADANKFTIDSTTGALAFAAAPDFETPTDVGGNNVYDVQVTASDGALSDVQDIAVTVTNANEAPTITSNGGGATASINVAENSTAVTTVVATDPDAATTLTYSISGGADAAKFTIDATTGALAFAAAPDFETPTDVGTNNVYDVQVTASDGALTDVQDIAVTVTNLNEAPTITSDGGGASAVINLAENIAAVTTVVATDPDAGTTLSYSISGGADASKFTIDSTTGALAFAAAPDFETPTDVGGNNVYDVQVTASDGTLSDVQDIAVTVTNTNEAPTITSNGGGVTASINVAENSTAVTTVLATDPDAVTTLTYSISGGADASKFTIDATTGALAFAAAPDFETPTDVGTNNVYDVQVTASDGTLTDAQDIAVTVTNLNEAPTITSDGGGASTVINLAENIAAVTTVVATDPDAGTTLTYSISGGADAAQFTIDAATGALAFAAAPDFETPTDVGGNNVYDVQVTASDGTLVDLQNISVLIANANEAPAITSNGGGVTASINVAENSTAVTTVVATDPDAGTTIAYSISGGADAALFTIDATTGALAFAAAPNFETPTDVGTNNVYDVQVTASDGTLTDVQDIAVTVTNQNETPTITSNGGGATAAISIAENSAAVTTVVATDPDAGTTLTYSISGGADAARFIIDSATGALAFAAAPDFETPTDVGANNVYDVQVTASDGTLSDVQDIAVTVTDANDAPVITSNGGGASASISITENTVAVTSVVATDQDLDTVTYSITGGADAAKFTINTTTGALAFAAAPDFETPTDGGANNVYNVQVTASDGTLSDMQAIAVTVTNANEAPTVANLIDDQVSLEDAAVGFVLPADTFDDPDGTTLTLTATLASGGALPGWLSFNPGTGAFTGQPPANFNGDISIRVTASDGTSAVSDTFTLSIIPVNDAPVAGDDVIRTQRDVAVSTAITVLLSNDFDPDGDTITLTGVSGPSNGTVSIVGNAVVFTPDAGFVGQGGFSYSITDGNGLGTVGTVTVNVGAVNSAPQVNPDTEMLFTLLGRAIAFDVVATDADGDVLAFAAGAPANGTITQGNGGAFVYTPDAGFLGTDTVTVIVSDADGASDTYTATINVVTPDTPDDWRLLTSDGWVGEIGGSGAVFGTNGFQDVAVLDIAGHIAFEPSFNGGGDVIRLAGSAADWHIARESSNAILFDGDTLVTIPVGIVGMAIVFDDGARELLFSVQGNTMSIGDQAFGEALARIDTAPDIGVIDDSAADPAATSSLLLQEGVDVTAGGRINIFGTGTAAEVVTLTYGAITLDPSFNEGGDSVVLDGDADSFTASRFGSSLLLEGAGYDLVIPVGIDGMEITFADDTRTLIYNPESDAVLLGNQTIGLEMIPVSEFA